GRIRRGGQVSGVLGVEAARAYASKAANYSRSEEARRTADERRRLEATERMVEVLGQMKGPAMKLGQMASLIDFNRLPDNERGELQQKLAELRDSSPEVPFEDMRKVIEHEL